MVREIVVNSTEVVVSAAQKYGSLNGRCVLKAGVTRDLGTLTNHFARHWRACGQPRRPRQPVDIR